MMRMVSTWRFFSKSKAVLKPYDNNDKPLIFSSSLWGDTKRCGPYEIIHEIWPRFWPPPLISVRTLRNNTMHEHMSIISVLYCFTLIYVLYLWIFVCVFWHNYASVLAALACTESLNSTCAEVVRSALAHVMERFHVSVGLFIYSG